MSKFISLLKKTSTRKGILTSFVSSQLTFITMMTTTLPIINKKVESKAFDLQPFGYSTATAKAIINKLDTETINLYLFPQLSFLDIMYPCLLAILLSSLLFRLMELTKTTKNKANYLFIIIPFMAMVFDYAENICIALMITKTIKISNVVVFTSSLFTITKSTLTSIAWLAIFTYSTLLVIQKVKNKKIA